MSNMSMPVHRNIVFICCLAVASLSRSYGQEQEATTVGGYGELHYNEPDGASKGQLDFHRFIIYVGHTFDDQMSFKSEIELEHTKLEAGSGQGGELSIEQAYIDWHFSPEIGMKAGIILPPVGIINQIHEPPTFNGVERPNVEQTIIPTTWREAGVGVYGMLAEGVQYQLYIVAGLQASGFTARDGIRGGRQEALRSSPMNPSLTGRLEHTLIPELKLGGSFFAGNTTDGVDSLGNGALMILSADVQYAAGRFSLRGVGAFESIGDADKINRAFGKNVADQLYGFYVEGGYNIMPLLAPRSTHSLAMFGRYEKYNTQSKVTRFSASPAHDRSEITLGTTYKPTYNTAFKLDYQFLNNGSDTDSKQLNIGIGYSF